MILQILIIFLCIKTNAQSTSNVFSQSLNFSVYKTEDDTQTLEDILDSSRKFQSPDNFAKKTDTEDVYWIRLDLKELEIPQENNVFLRHNSFDYGEIYFLNENSNPPKIGLFDQNSISKRIKYDNYYSEIPIAPSKLKDKEFLYLKVQRVTFFELIENWDFSFSKSSNDTSLSEKVMQDLSLYYIFIGICIIASLWGLSFFLMLKKPEFLFYAIYTATICLYVCGNKMGLYQYVFSNNYTLQYWVSYSMLFVIQIMYCIYLIKYLRSKENYPLFHFLMTSVIVLNITSIILTILFYFSNGYISIYFNLIYTTYYLATIPVLIYLFIIAKNALAYFVFFATLFLCIFCLGRTFLASPKDGLYLNSIHYVIIGATIEIVIFLFGLNYTARIQLLEQFKLKEVAHLNEAKALRAQISPHFIFNSLGSIQNFITRKESVSALKYLSKFSRLMRNVLESSIENKVVLTEEIKMLKDYLELESLRFSNVFSYAITIDDELDEHSIEVPFMILQPFVENAIIHGLLPKSEGDKILNINFKMESEDIAICEVDDTGVGRKSTVKEGYAQIKEKQSRGIEVTKQRLENLKMTAEPIKIVDKTDEEGNPTGTKVIIKIPI
ncbi:MAG: histidine kinase [Bacteroidota bacterium]